jgi:4,5-DOPA dioxygenase extradiol
MTRMPALFLGHGSPMNALERNRYTEVWRALGESLGTPRAILSISAHWYVPGTAVTAMPAPRTIHDFRGFPNALFETEYAAPGDPALARLVRELLAPAVVELDQSWGLDHGTWSVLVHVFPRANVPVIQLSLDATRPAREHYALARQLAPLREDGVVILGSGNVVHNLGMVEWGPDAKPHDWAREWNDQVRNCVLRRDHAPLLDDPLPGRAARLSVPSPDHYLPLLYVLAQQRDDEAATVPIDGIELASIGMMSVVIASAA